MGKLNIGLKLKGYVGDWDFDPDYIDWYLDRNSDKEVTIAVDSLGGSVMAAMSIVNSIKQHGNVRVHYIGFNASAATIISMGAKHVSIDAHAMYLVHKCSAFVCKFARCNADEMQRMIDSLEQSKRDLEKIDLNIAGMYASRCKKTKAELLALMSEGGWLNAQEAKEWGFVDEIVDADPVEESAKISDVVASALTEAGIPLPPGYESKKNGILQKIRAAISQIFENNQTNTIKSIAMAKILPLICAVLGLESLQLTDGKTELSESQIDALEKALGDKDAEIADLKAQVQSQSEVIENLKMQPAAATTDVIEDNSADSVSEDDFSAVARRAKEMFNAIN